MEFQADTVSSTEEPVSVPRDIISYDAAYTVVYDDDGVSLEVIYEKGAGEPIAPDYLIYDLTRRGIDGLNIPEVLAHVKRGDSLFRLAGPQEEKTADSDVAVHVSLDEMSASMMLFPPVAGGCKNRHESILELIQNKWGITHGLDETEIAESVDNEIYYKNLKIATGQKPVRGQNGYLTFQFKTEHTYAPHILSDGSADYKNLDIFESVNENDVVVTSTPPQEGIDGFTVKGKILPAQKGMSAKLPKGKNVKISEDGLSLIAMKNGRVDYGGGRVDVSDIYNIKGNVDMSTGNIDFYGDVSVKGNVISGLTVKATGSIEIYGVVEGATLIAGKDIVLKNGMQGMDKGVLQADGNVSARFIEHSLVNAKGNVCSDYIVHSTINAMGSVVMQGKHGKIIGGIVRAGKEVVSRSLGSPSGDTTLVEIGISPEMRVKLSELEESISITKSQIEKMNSIVKIIPATADLPPEKAAYFQKLSDAKEQLEQNYLQLSEEIEALKTVLSEKSGGKIHVISTVYQDVKIVIDSCPLTIKSSLDFVTFRYKEGEVVFLPCEKSSH